MNTPPPIRINHYNIPQPVVQSLMIWFPVVLILLAAVLSWGFMQKRQISNLMRKMHITEEQYASEKNKRDETIRKLEYDIRMLRPLEGKLKSAQRELEIANEDIEKYKQYKTDCDELVSITNRLSNEIAELVSRLNARSKRSVIASNNNSKPAHSCYYCNGTGYDTNPRRHNCSQCNGRGKITTRGTIITGKTSIHGYAKTLTKDISETCPRCNGKGFWTSYDNPCPRCKGRGE